ncbi:hypothetical protein KL941_001745 [Ogataea angusta]|nr:hypothetical protein KL941_001745 [Ogataea angusta]
MLRRVRPLCQIRLNSNVPRRPDEPGDLENIPKHSNVSSSGSIPPIKSSISNMLAKKKVEYNPEDNKEGVTYEFHAPQSPLEARNEQIRKSHQTSKWRKMLPSLAVGGALIWGFYAYNYFTADKKETIPDLLLPDRFLPYLVSFKYQVDQDHYLIELTRKNRGSILAPHQQLFNGKRLWSVDIKQPEINIVRNYTPLPLYVAGIDPDTHEPHLRLVTKPEEEGKFVLLVKRYDNGEFSRWLTSRNLLDEVELRGPVVEYKVPYHPLDKFPARPQLQPLLSKIQPDPEYPENIPKPETWTFYAAGTGVLPLLQMLYSPNPPKGFINAYVSLRNESNLPSQLKTLNYFAEKCGRAKFTYLISDNGDKLQAKHVSRPTLPNFSGLMDVKISEEVYRQKLLAQKRQEVKNQIQGARIEEQPLQKEDVIPKLDIRLQPQNAFQQFNFFRKQPPQVYPSFAFICGPESYISYVSGRANLNNLEQKDTGDIGGLLKDKGWTLSNIKRLI